jgi:hypothetical protein
MLMKQDLSAMTSRLAGSLKTVAAKSTFKKAVAVMGLAVLATGAAHAQDVRWSVTIGTPVPVYAPRPVVVYPAPQVVYQQPQVVYQQPQVVYQQPQVIYQQPPVVYQQPQVVYTQPRVIYRPAPVVYPQPVYYGPPGYWRHGHGHGGHHGGYGRPGVHIRVAG